MGFVRGFVQEAPPGSNLPAKLNRLGFPVIFLMGSPGSETQFRLPSGVRRVDVCQKNSLRSLQKFADIDPCRLTEIVGAAHGIRAPHRN